MILLAKVANTVTCVIVCAWLGVLVGGDRTPAPLVVGVVAGLIVASAIECAIKKHLR